MTYRLSALVLCLFLFASGCSFKKLAYRYADWLIMGRIDKAFDLSSTQEDALEPRIGKVLKRIDDYYLPRIIEFFQQAIERTKDKLSVEDSRWIVTSYHSLREEFFLEIADDAAWLLASLDEDHKSHFKEYLADSNEKLIDRLKLSDEELLEELSEKRFDNLEDYFGELSDEQKDRILPLLGLSRQRVSNRLAYRREFQKSVVSLVGQNEGAIAAKIRSWSRKPELMVNAEMQKFYDLRWNHTIHSMPKIDMIITDKQRLHLIDKMKELVEDLQDMVGQY